MRIRFVFLLAALAGCSGIKSRVEGGRVQAVIKQNPATAAYFEVIGIGAADPALATDTQRRALARDAAIVKAQYELLSLVKGVAVEGGVKVSKAMAADSLIEARVHDSIAGAEVLMSEFTDDGGCVVTMRLPKKSLETALGTRLP